MNHAHSDPNIAEQIHQIEQNVRLDPSAWIEQRNTPRWRSGWRSTQHLG